ncbi:unnamed protein product, partial [Polarella glacialis]
EDKVEKEFEKRSVIVAQKSQERLSGSGAKTADESRRRSAAYNGDSRRRRFTVSVTKVAIAPPPANDVLELLNKVPFFADFSMQERLKLSGAVKCNRYEPDEIVTNWGCPHDAVHMIVSGTGKVCVPQELHQMMSGDFFGEEALRYAGALSQHQVVATGGRLTTISIDRSTFKALNLNKKSVQKHTVSKFARKQEPIATSSELDPSVKDGICTATNRPVREFTQTAQDKEMIITSLRNNKVIADVLSLSQTQFEMICDRVHMVAISHGEALCTKGEKGNALFILHEGVLDIQLPEDKVVHLPPG